MLFKTQRLLLRTVELSDAKTIFEYRSKPEVYRYQGYKPSNVRHVIRLISSVRKSRIGTQGTWHQLAIIERESGKIAGDVGIHFLPHHHAELGYTLAPEYQGRGYAIEAVSCVLDYLFRKLKKHRVTASTDPRNKKSMRLLERVKMRQEALFKKSYWTGKAWMDDAVYAILNHEWSESQQ